MNIDVIVPDALRKAYDAFHYAPAVREAGLIFCSGVIGQGDTAEAEFRDAWEKIGAILAVTAVVLGLITRSRVSPACGTAFSVARSQGRRRRARSTSSRRTSPLAAQWRRRLRGLGFGRARRRGTSPTCARGRA